MWSVFSVGQFPVTDFTRIMLPSEFNNNSQCQRSHRDVVKFPVECVKAQLLMVKTKPFSMKASVAYGTTEVAQISHQLCTGLSNSDDPFVCLACTNTHLKQEITQPLEE